MDRSRSVTTDERSANVKPTPDQDFPSSPTRDLAIPSALLPILPDEVINEILLRLPVKSLGRFKCVSRSWLSYISSSEFIKAHLKISTSSRDSQRILVKGYVEEISTDDDCVKQCSLNCLLCDEISTDVVMFDDLNWEVPSRSIVLVGSSNGLVCIHAYFSGLFLWNPSTGKSKELPDSGIKLPGYSDLYHVVFGFGYDEINDDYKVVEIVCTCGVLSRQDINVYSMRNESWKRLGNFQGGYIAQEECGILLNGKLHWSLQKQDHLSICCVDLTSETCTEMGLPKFEGYFVSILDILQGSLCLLCWQNCNEHTDVWIMKEYGIRESWMKVLSIPDHESCMYPIHKLLCTSEDGKILLTNGSDLALYNANDGSFRSYKVGLSSSSADLEFTMADACVYVESLVSL